MIPDCQNCLRPDKHISFSTFNPMTSDLLLQMNLLESRCDNWFGVRTSSEVRFRQRGSNEAADVNNLIIDWTLGGR